MDTRQIIGLRIKNKRMEKGLTQEALAEQVGISSKYLSSIERGKENPTLTTLLKLAKSLNAPPSEFFPNTKFEDPQEKRLLINELLNLADPEQLKIIHQVLSFIIKK